MFQHWIMREPTLAFGFPVYIFAAFLFPLHLGWVGASWLAFAGYLLIAAALFSIVDALMEPTYYPKLLSVVPQSFFSLLALGVPSAVLFTIGLEMGPVDESLDEQVCASQGAAEADTLDAEADDSFDITADCVERP